MKQTLTRLALAAFASVLLVTGCMEQSEDTSGLVARINYVGLKQADGQYRLGLDYDITGQTGDVEITVYIDDNAAESLTYTSEEDGVAFIDVGNPGTEGHTVFIAAVDASGQQAASEEKSWSRAMRKVLVEVITSANCTPCAPANEEYKLRTESEVAQLRIATIKYHVWWPRPTDSLFKHSKEWVEPRVKSYLPEPTTWVAPQAFVDGLSVGNKAGDWVQQAEIDQEISAGAEIILSKIDNGNTVDIAIDIHGITTGQYGDLRLHTVVTESDIHYNDGNAEQVHYEVMKRMLPGHAGEDVTIQSGQEQTYTRTIEIQDGETKSNMHVVVFLQSEGTGDVLQAATIAL